MVVFPPLCFVHSFGVSLFSQILNHVTLIGSPQDWEPRTYRAITCSLPPRVHAQWQRDNGLPCLYSLIIARNCHKAWVAVTDMATLQNCLSWESWDFPVCWHVFQSIYIQRRMFLLWLYVKCQRELPPSSSLLPLVCKPYNRPGIMTGSPGENHSF